MSNIILDASAFLTLLKNEPGADQIESLLGNIIMSSLSVSDVVTELLNAGMSLENCEAIVLPLISVIIPFDETQVFLIASLKSEIKEPCLSLSNVSSISLAQEMNFPLYTANELFSMLKLDNLDVKLIK